ncbi:hypothetical protein [Spirosoma linguale]|uniref:Uncharacterized protein n=1 Tax=Spirosoma linguale (strain ATCC 33905 / DSM 74 / LMG 10896 / Claus 1) TaxID=504472 RepID=D2QI80_SPILD|nr:hypothetical protein Slin_0916 [Spirosoma linguale DSM 74]
MDAKHTPDFYSPSRHWWRLFTSTIWLIGLLGAGTLGVVSWRIYQQHRPGMPVLRNNQSGFRTLAKTDSINRHDSRDRVLARSQHIHGTQVTVH